MACTPAGLPIGPPSDVRWQEQPTVSWGVPFTNEAEHHHAIASVCEPPVASAARPVNRRIVVLMLRRNRSAMSGRRLFSLTDPGGDRLPIGIVFGKELAAAAVKLVAACFVRQGMNQDQTCFRLIQVYQLRHRLKVAARLFVGPGASLRQRLQTEGIIGRAVARNASRVARTLLGKDRLNRLFVRLIVERLPYRQRSY